MRPDKSGEGASLGAASAQVLRSSIDQLVRNQPFTPSAPSLLTRLRRRRLPGRVVPPAAETIRAPSPATRWNCLFLFVPGGVLDDDQRAILARVRALAGALLVVVATGDPTDIPDALGVADALIWKGLSGFDHSAYALALTAIAQCSPGATAYVQNDSVLGPFGDLDALVGNAPWDLTGFIGSPAIEAHFSTFAFILKDVTPARMEALSPVLSTQWSYDDFGSVVLAQETRLARVAVRSMTVGSLWYLPVRPAEPSIIGAVAERLGFVSAHPPYDARGDATLGFPLALLDQEFPFLKRSLFTKFAGLVPETALRAGLAAKGWGQPR